MSPLKLTLGLFMFACLLLLTACGQKGDLYLPEAEAQQLQPASTFTYMSS